MRFFLEELVITWMGFSCSCGAVQTGELAFIKEAGRAVLSGGRLVLPGWASAAVAGLCKQGNVPS